MSVKEEFVLVKEAAEMLGVCPNTIRAWGAISRVQSGLRERLEMRNEENSEQFDHEAGSSRDGLGDEPTSVDGQLILEPNEGDDGQYDHDFIDYLNKRFCGFNGS